MEVKEIKIYKFSATFTAWLALVLLMVTLLAYVIAMATPAWGVVNISHGNYVVSGLWIRCEHYSGYKSCHSLVGTEGVSSTFVWSQCLSVIGLLMLCLALITSGAYVFISVFSKDQRAALLVAMMALVSAMLITITCVTFTVGDKEDAQSTLPKPNPIPVTFTMSYSFGFAIFSSLIAAASGAIMVFELLNTKHMIPM